MPAPGLRPRGAAGRVRVVDGDAKPDPARVLGAPTCAALLNQLVRCARARTRSEGPDANRLKSRSPSDPSDGGGTVQREPTRPVLPQGSGPGADPPRVSACGLGLCPEAAQAEPRAAEDSEDRVAETALLVAVGRAHGIQVLRGRGNLHPPGGDRRGLLGCRAGVQGLVDVVGHPEKHSLPREVYALALHGGVKVVDHRPAVACAPGLTCAPSAKASLFPLPFLRATPDSACCPLTPAPSRRSL